MQEDISLACVIYRYKYYSVARHLLTQPPVALHLLDVNGPTKSKPDLHFTWQVFSSEISSVYIFKDWHPYKGELFACWSRWWKLVLIYSVRREKERLTINGVGILSAPSKMVQILWEKMFDELVHVIGPCWCPVVLMTQVNIGPGNDLAPDGAKPLPEPTLTYHQRGILAFTLGHSKTNNEDINR